MPDLEESFSIIALERREWRQELKISCHEGGGFIV